MNAKQRIQRLEKTSKPKPKEHAAHVVIYKVGEDLKAKAAKLTGSIIFIPDNLRDKVTA
jgi:hypothetical protein